MSDWTSAVALFSASNWSQIPVTCSWITDQCFFEAPPRPTPSTTAETECDGARDVEVGADEDRLASSHCDWELLDAVLEGLCCIVVRLVHRAM